LKIADWIMGGEEVNRLSFNGGILFLRIFIGLFIAFGHGINKIPPAPAFINLVSGLGFPFPEFFAWMAGISEFFGGLFLAVGFLTRPSSFFLSITMLAAAFLRHAADPFSRKELALLYLFIFLFLLLTGAGQFSVDFILRKKHGHLQS